MDSPDRMSWTPSSSAKKRKYDEHIESSPQLHVPGAYPSSPVSINTNRDHYLASPTPAARFVHQPVPAQHQGSMHGYIQVPQFLGPLVQMVATAGTTAQTISSSTLGVFAGPGARIARCINNTTGPLYGYIEVFGNTAKRVKLTVWPERNSVSTTQPSTPTPQPSTPPRRISHNINPSPSPTRRSESSILHNTRETGLRKTRQTLRWVEEQRVFGELVHEFENVEAAITDRPQNDTQPMDFVPLMTGALQADDLHAVDQAFDVDAMLVDDSEFDSQDSYDSDGMHPSDERESSPSSVSSYISDSVTSSMLEGLTEEDLKNVETRQEKKERKRRERNAERDRKAAIVQWNEEKAASDPNCLLAQLRRIADATAPSHPLKKSVAFYSNPNTGNPVAVIKEFDSEDPITSPVKADVLTSRAIFSAIRAHKGRAAAAHENPAPPTSSTTDESSSPVSVTGRVSRFPEVANGLEKLKVSSRRASKRQSDLDIAAQFEREQQAAAAAEEAERIAKQEAERRAIKEARQAEERTRLGIRRMPTGRVIQPLTPEWDDKVISAMRVGLSSARELARTSAGTTLNRRDLGHVLPQRGDSTGGWLNDTIITGYLQAVVDYGKKMRSVKRGELPRVHAFSTFLYTNLKERGYDSVKNWAIRAKFGGKDLLRMEKIFIPINKGGNHWVLIHINPQTKTIEYFDSFHNPAGEIVHNVKKWLKGELREAWEDSEWTLLERGGPTQNNASDCGVFLSTTAKMIVLGVDPMAFSATDMPTQRRIMVAELINGGFEGDFTPNITF
ncbi:MAG: hypothetical protein Q9181_000823 [Wetmoreana brouardii]